MVFAMLSGVMFSFQSATEQRESQYEVSAVSSRSQDQQWQNW